MALYEVVFDREDGTREIRFTDHKLRRNRPFSVDSVSYWKVVRVEQADHPLALQRYVCVRQPARGDEE